MTTYLRSPDGFVFTSDRASSHPDCTRLTAKAGKAAHRAQAQEKLRAILKPGQTVYTILRHCSRSGMSRQISLSTVHDGEMRDLDYLAAIAMDDKVGNKGGIVIGGCGMDMGFSLVYDLGRTLWREGTPEPHGTRNGEPDSDGGYALKHSWL